MDGVTELLSRLPQFWRRFLGARRTLPVSQPQHLGGRNIESGPRPLGAFGGSATVARTLEARRDALYRSEAGHAAWRVLA